MAADYILEQQMEEIEEQRKDFIAETAATFVIVNGVDRSSAIDAVKKALDLREEYQNDISVCIPGDEDEADQWLTPETQLPPLPDNSKQRSQIAAVAKELRVKLD